MQAARQPRHFGAKAETGSMARGDESMARCSTVSRGMWMVFSHETFMNAITPFHAERGITLAASLRGFSRRIPKLLKFRRHRRIAPGQLLDRHILRLVIRKAQIAVCTDQCILGLL